MSDYQGETLKNGLIGALVTLVAYLVPVLNAIAPIFGGGVAGYLQSEGAGGGIKVGAVTGIFMTIPAIIIAVVASGLIAQVPVVGGLLGGALVLIVLVVLAHAVLLGVIGGLLGGIVSGHD